MDIMADTTVLPVDTTVLLVDRDQAKLSLHDPRRVIADRLRRRPPKDRLALHQAKEKAKALVQSNGLNGRSFP